AAHLLHGQHEVTVFEECRKVGGHTNTIRVDTAYETHHVDTGFIVFNDRNYPNFERLLMRLGVEWQPSQMSFGVSDATGEFEYSSVSANGLYATRRHLLSPSFHHMLVEVRRFQREARALLTGNDRDPSLGEWLEELRFSRLFIDRLIVPQASAVWSADPRQMWTFPARFLLSFFDNHGVLHLRDRPKWRTVRGGSQTYVDALTASFAHRIRTSTPVAAIERHESHVTITPRGGEPENFDHVILAVHSDQALRMLADVSDREHEILAAIPYQPNEAVLHTDRRLLPRRRRAWASWNYHLGGESTGRSRVTYHMNRLQSLSADREFCVTLNRSEAIDPDKVIRTIEYSHPVYTSEGSAAQRRHAEISGVRRTHYCGAYWGYGFHEDGVVSALRVAEKLGARLP
ncbi:MAG TPA: FAD-dependent oxidoreductase, partial [Thermoleophilaceae bacterium]|nr:FAD-dependent oxidoreductase [Thermoleophilaceae bacterium]